MTRTTGSDVPLPTPPKELLLVCGDERHLVDADAAAWWSQARSACLSDLNCEVVDSPTDVAALGRTLAEAPFLDDRRYVLLRDPPQLADRARRGVGSAEELAGAVARRAPTTSLCIVVHGPVPATHPLRRAVLAAGGEVHEHSPLRPRELRCWIAAEAERRGLSLEPPSLDHLVATTGGDLGAIASELDKLAAYAEGRGRVRREEIEALVAGSEQVQTWSILDRLFSGRPAGAISAVEALLGQGTAVPQLVAALASQIRELVVASEIASTAGGGRKLVARLAGDLRLPPWRAERLARWAGQVDPRIAESWLRGLQAIDARSKLGEAIDTEALRRLVLEMVAAIGHVGRPNPSPR